MSLRRSRGTPVERRIGPVKPQLQRVGGGEHADVAQAVDEDAVAIDQRVHASDELFVLQQDLAQPLEPAVGQVARQPADAAVACR